MEIPDRLPQPNNSKATHRIAIPSPTQKFTSIHEVFKKPLSLVLCKKHVIKSIDN